MGRNRILLLSLAVAIVVSVVVSTAEQIVPAVSNIISKAVYTIYSDIFQNPLQMDISQDMAKVENVAPGRDKKVCGTCHSDKSNDFKRKYQHAPFVKWMCTDCHVPHNLGSGKYEFVVDVDKLCSSCHYDRKGEKGMSLKHLPYDKGRCTDCHDPHASDHPKQLILPQSQLCVSCHNLGMKYNFSVKHPPYAKGNCTDCHSPHASNNRGLTALPGKQLCVSCHYDIAGDLKKPVTHKPVVEGNCVDCHGPHATPNAKLLILSKDKLCFSCHNDKAMESKTGYQHKPFVTGDCVGCHTPHAGSNEWLLLREKSELCYMCHGKYRDIFKGNSYHPVGNGLLECYGCHDPHSGPGKKMTRAAGNKLCYICHLGLQESYEKLSHATKAKGKGGIGSCLNCHQPHASAAKPLLQGNQKDVCGQCHGKVVKAAITHPVGEKAEDNWHGGKVWCTSCHGPHGTEYKNFTLLPKDGLCLKCHGQKLKDNPKYYSVHRLIPPKNEPKPKTIKTIVPKN